MTLAEAARNAGLLVVYEPYSVPRTELSRRAVSLSNIVKIALGPNRQVVNWQEQGASASTYVIETLGPLGVRLLYSRCGSLTRLAELRAPAQTCVRDRAGAGDWLTAGLINYLLNSSGTMNEETIRMSLEYGQQLSTASIAFDGPRGILDAIGARGVEDIARGVPYERAVSGATIRSSAQSKAGGMGEDVCRLCLAETRLQQINA